MTLEEPTDCSTHTEMESVCGALEELLLAAREQDCLTVGVDPDSVVLCVLACDEEDECDVVLQMHFTLIQAFCFETRVDMLRVSGMSRLAHMLEEPRERDLNCILVACLPKDAHLLGQAFSHDCDMELGPVGQYCRESRTRKLWLPASPSMSADPQKTAGDTTSDVIRKTSCKLTPQTHSTICVRDGVCVCESVDVAERCERCSGQRAVGRCRTRQAELVPFVLMDYYR